jgi:hypothetical protein
VRSLLRRKQGEGLWMSRLRITGMVLAALAASISVWNYMVRPLMWSAVDAVAAPLHRVDEKLMMDAARDSINTDHLFRIEAMRDSIIIERVAAVDHKVDVVIRLMRRP